jgi:protease II
MSDFAILNELIKASVQVPIQLDQNQKRFFYLEEKQDNYGVTIRGISDETDIFVIDADQFPAPKMFFKVLGASVSGLTLL